MNDCTDLQSAIEYLENLEKKHEILITKYKDIIQKKYIIKEIIKEHITENIKENYKMKLKLKSATKIWFY